MTDTQPMSPLKVAAVQFDMQVGLDNKEANVESCVRLIREAAAAGAQLVVLPELATTGYSFSNREEAYQHAEAVPDGPTIQRLVQLCADEGLYVVCGVAELDGVLMYDTAVLIGPDGYVGRYRKTHLWNREKLVFEPGNEGFPVFDTPVGRIGLLICWDIWFPEVARILAAQGADIICSTNDWVFTPPPLFDESGKAMASYLTMAASHSNGVPIIAADRVGEERGAKFLGCSLITGHNGWPIGGVASAEEETILYADLDVVASRSAVVWNTLNDLPRDRRRDLYDELLGYPGQAQAR
ncbi:nitrilase family protein [Ornithinicoccus hortensis]|uniref:Putative amidohydrolase n=1 Tax=Ornithinicoccus hortensis TaxID=82346 RepID=A0A542YWK9_9MICO|nr:nitrilase family protein [Ornithinicoccus hortensis]TQL52476.1 putative amidohydrolase [Ornithinicoccus hortensis]